MPDPLRRTAHALLPLALLGCADKAVYDLDAWQSPLASGFSGTPDAAEGERLYHEEQWTDATPYALTCAACHGNDPADTLEVDAHPDWNGAGHTTWNVAWRETWKISQTWDLEESDVLGAYGGQICVTAYYPEGSAMTAEQAAHLEAWLKTRKDGDPGGDPRAAPLDYSFTDWDTQDDFLASLSDGAGGELRGAELGDVEAGEALAARHCGACHTEGAGGPPTLYSAAASTPSQLAARVRKAEVDGEPAPNDRMPRLSHDRLPDEDLRDLLAWLTAG